MSPEQFSAPQDVGPASDIFSLGAVVAYAATGRGPFDAPSPYQTALRVVDGDPGLDGVPDELLPFVTLCLAKPRKSRPTPDELLTLLRNGTPPAPRPAGPPAEPDIAVDGDDGVRPRRRRRRLLIAGAAVTALLAAVTATAAAISDEDSSAARDLPEGFEAWREKAKRPGAGGGSFSRCAAAGTSLLCAGNDLMAARFALADGSGAWSRHVDPTPGSFGLGEGTIIGTRDGRAFVYADDITEQGPENAGATVYRYTVQAIDPDTGRVHWATGTGSGDTAVAPDPHETGEELWEGNSTVEEPGPPLVSATHVYLASYSGRLAALDRRTGKVTGALPGRDDAGEADYDIGGAPFTLVGDALYVPYGVHSVYAVDVTTLLSDAP
ncbi:outer membrane protein assembly factor BamB family protein [Streptomyces sp. NPDC002845]